jgi:hypothetical protein
MRSGVSITKCLTGLMIIVFSLYAVSPLAKSFPQPDEVAGTEKPAARIFLVHLLLSNMFDGRESAASSQTDADAEDYCFVKKKRAVLSSKDLLSLISLSHISTPEIDRARPELANIFPAAEQLVVPMPSSHDVVLSLHPCNAPPAA